MLRGMGRLSDGSLTCSRLLNSLTGRRLLDNRCLGSLGRLSDSLTGRRLLNSLTRRRLLNGLTLNNGLLGFDALFITTTEGRH